MGERYQFPLLFDLILSIGDKLDQPLDEQGQFTYRNPDAFVRACNEAYRRCWRGMSRIDARADRFETTITVTAGSTTTVLPTSFRQLYQAWEVDAAGNERRRLTEGSDDDMGRREYDFIVTMNQKLPSIRTGDGAPYLRWTSPVRSTFLCRVTYGRWPIRLFHGVARSGSLTTMQLGAHESRDTGTYVGQNYYLVGGAGSETNTFGMVTAYDGPTQTATVTQLTVIPDDGTVYTCRPDLHPDFEDAFVHIAAAALTTNKKLREDLALIGRDMLTEALEEIGSSSRTDPQVTRGDMSAIVGGHGDPIFYGW